MIDDKTHDISQLSADENNIIIADFAIDEVHDASQI
jgi:hypothetical protein